MDSNLIGKAAALLQREFGPTWREIAQTLGTEDLRRRVGKELTSFVAYPERGDGGDNKWRGNCSPEIVKAILQYVLDCKRYYGKDTSTFTLLDPMSGSGTSKAAADRCGVKSILYDLNPTAPQGIGGWDALKHDVEDSADLIFLHPPYHSIIQYSGRIWGNKPHPDDLSRCENYRDFLDKLNYIVKKLFLALRKDGRLAILVGDIRKHGQFYSMQNDVMRLGEFESFIVKGQFNCVSDGRAYQKPFVPIVTEYLLLFHKLEALMISFSRRLSGEVNILQRDDVSLTWNHLIRLTIESVGGRAKLSDLYTMLENHPKARVNPHYRDRIRATI